MQPFYKKNPFEAPRLLIYTKQVNGKRDVSCTLYSERTMRMEAAQR